MLGVAKETDDGLYQENNKGKYYARILPDGKFDEKMVCLLSHEQATEFETAKAMEGVQHQTKAKAEEIKEKLNLSLCS